MKYIKAIFKFLVFILTTFLFAFLFTVVFTIYNPDKARGAMIPVVNAYVWFFKTLFWPRIVIIIIGVFLVDVLLLMDEYKRYR